MVRSPSFHELIHAGADVLTTNTFGANRVAGIQVSAPLGKIANALAVIEE